MASNSKIEWTDHTFNGWWGCTKVHGGCTNCYADALDHRWGGDHWGKDSPRRFIIGEWGKPAKWNREAAAAGRIDRVFCSSMCDVFEDFDGEVVNQQGEVMWWAIGESGKMIITADPDEPVEWVEMVDLDSLRSQIWRMVVDTPNLMWQFLTKRPENVTQMVPDSWLKSWPSNVMTGTSPCDQKTADKCIPELLKVPGRRFLSFEPLLGRIDIGFDAWFHADYDRTRPASELPCAIQIGEGIHWCIIGGESGPRARACNIEWIRDIVSQCRAAGVPCFVKQLGASYYEPEREWLERERPSDIAAWTEADGRNLRRLRDPKGGDMSEWPEDLRVRELPESEAINA